MPSTAGASLPTQSAAKQIVPKEERSFETIQEELKKKEVLYQVNMEIQQRMRQMNLPTQSSHQSASLMKKASTLKADEASAYVDYQMNKLNRLAELKQRLSNKSTAVAPMLGAVVKGTPAVALEGIVGERAGKVSWMDVLAIFLILKISNSSQHPKPMPN